MHFDITLLCKVVDNYGDIGFVYRLTRALSQLHKDFSLRLIVDDLAAFASLAPEIHVHDACQIYRLDDDRVVTVYDWNDRCVCSNAFRQDPPQVILECFQCGRPDWLETLLFDEGFDSTVHIINIDYLTAEPYADEFHKLASLTRSAKVKKTNFMPGFTDKTGGLTLDEPFVHHLHDTQAALAKVAQVVPEVLQAKQKGERIVVVFSYERDFVPVVQTLSQVHEKQPLHVFVAAGRGRKSFESAYSTCKASFPLTTLPFMQQEDWDALLCISDFSFVRGEDSLSRACLVPVPYIWHAYPQDDEYQQVKVQALLHRMQPFFDAVVYEILEEYWLLYNHMRDTSKRQQVLLQSLFDNYDSLRQGFAAFSSFVLSHGNLAEHLYEYIIEDIL
ncbi:MAG: elongation factor P maturation arginine rhamnosyltransferase EarP [Treponema sp.]|nr:elongation factor P maturation arginine rhamnosyltransferase EarP [Treponema sp.]